MPLQRRAHRPPSSFVAIRMLCALAWLPAQLVAGCHAATWASAPLAPALGVVQPASDPMLDFRQHALNALLVPLLDDDDPPRWVDPASTMSCLGGASVSIDGRPLVPRERVPVAPFVLRWTMDGCMPLDDAVPPLSGIVELTVFHDGDVYSAMIAPALHAAGGGRAAQRTAQAYSATTPLVGPCGDCRCSIGDAPC
jgi:hypothetical protein